MVLDYSGQRPVPKNRPRKQPVGIYVVILLAAISLSFGLGVVTGWFLHKPARKAPQLDAQAVPGAPQQGLPANPEAKPGLGEPPLTFYETLPKGGKAIIGSGLNPRKSGETFANPPAVTPQPVQAVQAGGQPSAAKTDERKEQQAAQPAAENGEQRKEQRKTEGVPSAKQPEGSGRFCVQIASSQDRKEAEALKAKLAERGLPAFVAESAVKDRGTWFRVRIGRHLSQQAAGELAAKAGKGAIVISE